MSIGSSLTIIAFILFVLLVLIVTLEGESKIGFTDYICVGGGFSGTCDYAKDVIEKDGCVFFTARDNNPVKICGNYSISKIGGKK